MQKHFFLDNYINTSEPQVDLPNSTTVTRTTSLFPDLLSDEAVLYPNQVTVAAIGNDRPRILCARCHMTFLAYDPAPTGRFL